MNLKRLIWFSPFVVFLSCAHLFEYQEDNVDRQLVGEIWKEVARVTGTNPDIPIPRIVFLEDDLYQELKKLHCKFLEKEDEQKCLAKREELFGRLERKYGKSVSALYLTYLVGEWNLAEKCSNYQKSEKEKCEEDQKKLFNIGALARIFFGASRIELYLSELRENFYSYQKLHNKWFRNEEKAHFYGTVAHELLHYAYWKKGIDANEHHKLMLESKNLETVLDALSHKMKVEPNGIHKYLHLRSLERGIEGDEAQKRILERKNSEIKRNKINEQK